MTLGVLKGAGNERLWFNTTLKLAKLHMMSKDFKSASVLIRELHR